MVKEYHGKHPLNVKMQTSLYFWTSPNLSFFLVFISSPFLTKCWVKHSHRTCYIFLSIYKSFKYECTLATLVFAETCLGEVDIPLLGKRVSPKLWLLVFSLHTVISHQKYCIFFLFVIVLCPPKSLRFFSLSNMQTWL